MKRSKFCGKKLKSLMEAFTGPLLVLSRRTLGPCCCAMLAISCSVSLRFSASLERKPPSVNREREREREREVAELMKFYGRPYRLGSSR